LETSQLEIDDLTRQEASLDEDERIVQHSLKSLVEVRQIAQLAYVSSKDIRGIPFFREHTLFAFKAPSGAELTVPVPEESENGKRYGPPYHLTLRSMKRGPIDAILLCNNAPAEEEPAADGSPEKRARLRELSREGSQVVRLSPPPVDGDYVYHMAAHEGVADLFSIDQS
jgi:transcription factor E2F4/5